ncbi:MAG: crossover junction endodeoxyribonuclease RuvC [Bdellovibrionales bacterium]
MKIIAIDPGYERVGIAILEKHSKGNEVLLHSECFKTSSKLPHTVRLGLIGEKINSIIKLWKPEALSIEKLFFNTNQKTALSVAEARGVIVYEAVVANLSVYEYTPLQVKIAVTGYGRSEKKAVMSMVPKLISISKKIKSDDEFDAIALGLTFFASDFTNSRIQMLHHNGTSNL